MKKVLIIGLIVALALIFIGGAGVVYARVRGVDNNAFVTTYTTKNGTTIQRQFDSGRGVIITENNNGPCPVGPQGEFGLNVGPGGMMGGYRNDNCPGDYGYGYGPGGMMQGYGSGGMMGGRGNFNGRGMMNGRGWGVDRGEGFMHDDMIAAFATAVNLTTEEVQTRLDNGETLKEIAIAQGITAEQLPDLVTNVRKAALDAAVADGTITQAQADVMLEHMDQYMGQGFGPGFGGGFRDCPMMDGDEVQQP